MTLDKFILIVAVIALLMTLWVRKRSRNLLMSYLQNFLGVFFLISGFVKAVDPLGTAYKMEEYFENFYYTFDESKMSWLAPIFPKMAEYAVSISVGMVVFEMLLGLMLIIGAYRKFTAWAFLLLMLVFTALTGFTYLNGYVPEGVNFFEFSKWGPFVETQMKVTDCGCFGDFMKLKPWTTFMKDVIMLVPGLIFIFGYRKMHQLFSRKVRIRTVWVSTVGLLLFAWSNYIWDLPIIDFRPFKEGVNIKKQKQAESEAEEAVQIISYSLTNKKTGKIVEIPYEQFMKEYKKYPKEEWSYKQNKTEPTLPHTKISDFEIQDIDGNNVTDEILDHEGYSLMFISKGLKKNVSTRLMTVLDTAYVTDTVQVSPDSTVLVKKIDGVTESEVEKEIYSFPDDFVRPFREKLVPLAKAAKKDGIKSFLIVGMEDPEVLRAFAKEIGADFPVYMADDILLKTIIRSNPGIVLLKDATIVKKWHYKKLPTYSKIKAEHIEMKE